MTSLCRKRRSSYDIADVIVDVRPDIIITHNPYDETPAHANATRMVILAMEAAKGFRSTNPVRPHTVRQVFYHTQHGRSANETVFARVPTTLIDITEVVHKKARAMNKFRSQWYGEDRPTQRKLDSLVKSVWVRVLEVSDNRTGESGGANS